MTDFTRIVPLLFILSACGSDNASETADPHSATEIRTYDIDQGNARDIANTISVLVQDEGARARTLGQNLIVVSAPESLHQGIERLIEQLREVPPEPTMRIRLHYWLVRGKPSDISEIPSNLYPVRQALTEAAATVGSMTYRRLDYVQQIMTSDRRNHVVDGDVLRAETNAVTVDGKIGLNMMLHERARRVGAYVEMDDGETILLAQIGVNEQGKQDRTETQEGEVLMFLVRAERF